MQAQVMASCAPASRTRRHRPQPRPMQMKLRPKKPPTIWRCTKRIEKPATMLGLVGNRSLPNSSLSGELMRKRLAFMIFAIALAVATGSDGSGEVKPATSPKAEDDFQIIKVEDG